MEPLVFTFTNPVFIHFFYLRAHRAGEYFKKDKNVIQKNIRIYLKGEIVVENSIILTNTEWVNIRPSAITESKIGGIIGDRLYIDPGVDFDSLNVSFGNNLSQVKSR